MNEMLHGVLSTTWAQLFPIAQEPTIDGPIRVVNPTLGVDAKVLQGAQTQRAQGVDP